MTPDEAMNVRGPCSGCGAQLASDQRYCVECGQRVGPPLALPYSLAAQEAESGASSGRVWRLPVPPEMAGLFAALALGFGVVIGTAISPNLAGIVAAPAPSVVAQAPPEAPPAPTGGSGGGGPAAPAPAPGPAAAVAFPTQTVSSGGGGGGGGGKKNKKPATGISFSGTVVRVNPVAQSYTISTGGGLISIHADTLPQVGAQVESTVRKLANGTYAEDGGRTPVGNADVASFQGTVTYCADLQRPELACTDAFQPDDTYVYGVSSVGASVVVTAPDAAIAAPPGVGSEVQVAVQIGADFKPIDPIDPAGWRRNPDCTPPYDEQNGLPSPPIVTKELTQTTVTVTEQATNALLESVLQTKCLGAAPTLVMSADDVRESGRDLVPLGVPAAFDLNKVNPGQAVQAAVDIAADGSLTLQGMTSDQGAAGADDASQGQGTLAGT